MSGQSMPGLPRDPVEAAASKVPEVGICFWVTKVAITGANVAWPDDLYRHHGVMLVSGNIGLVVVLMLALQLSLDGHHAWIYWLTMSALSVAGTEAANGLHAVLGFPYLIAAIWYLAVLAAVLMAWRAVEHTLSLRSIVTPRREKFYWAAITAAFALGSAIGHLTASWFPALSPAGYLALWAAVTGVTALAWWRRWIDQVIAFWLAFAVTRPLGAAIAEVMALPPRIGGLGLGQRPVTLGLAITVAALVGYLARTRRARQQ